VPKNRRVRAPAPIDNELTPREAAVADLLCMGHSNKIIADELHVSQHTVKFHIMGLTRKLNGPKNGSRVLAAVRWALKRTHEQLNTQPEEVLEAPRVTA